MIKRYSNGMKIEECQVECGRNREGEINKGREQKIKTGYGVREERLGIIK